MAAKQKKKKKKKKTIRASSFPPACYFVVCFFFSFLFFFATLPVAVKCERRLATMHSFTRREKRMRKKEEGSGEAVANVCVCPGLRGVLIALPSFAHRIASHAYCTERINTLLLPPPICVFAFCLFEGG